MEGPESSADLLLPSVESDCVKNLEKIEICLFIPHVFASHYCIESQQLLLFTSAHFRLFSLEEPQDVQLGGQNIYLWSKVPAALQKSSLLSGRIKSNTVCVFVPKV